MATLVLTAVGTAVGGPIGGMIGAIAGQAIDAELFKPKGRQGPRLGDLAVQTSAYGSAIPKLFGTMRVAGTVIWATDLKEQRHRDGGGKGKPSTTTYSYSASFAVALSARRLRAVRRIWADGKLLRGAGGDFKTETGYRLYLGGEGQAADPLIASAEGDTPAFRGVAYSVFEDFQLEDYGNRIPSLSFEIEADAAPPSIGAIATVLSDGDIADGGTPAVTGYAATGEDVRSAIAALGEAASLALTDDGARLMLGGTVGVAEVIDAVDIGVKAGEVGGRSRISRRSAANVPGEVSIAYLDPARDYQSGLQRATRGAATAVSERIALPAAVSAGGAKAMAERRLTSLWAERVNAQVHLPCRRAALRPGKTVRLDGEAGLWRIRRATLQAMVLSLELSRAEAGRIVDTAEASAGRPIGHPDLQHGATILHLLDLPLDEGVPLQRPHLLVAAAGSGQAWRRAALLARFDGGGWREAGPTASPAVLGTAASVLAASGSALIDDASSVDVILANGGMWLEGRDDAALVAGDNLALLGEELIQFGRAEPLGARGFRLSRLLRGRRGTEWAAGSHLVGERFVMIDRASLAVLEAPAIGAQATISAQGLGDAEPVTVSSVVQGEALRPRAPVHLQAVRRSEGSIGISWVRRSRAGWNWNDAEEAPLGEERELYRVTLTTPTAERRIVTAAPTFIYNVEAQLGDGAEAGLSVSVVQLGTFAQSRTASIAFMD